MSTFYDKEINILEYLHEMPKKECAIISDEECSHNYYETAKIIDDILDDNYLNIWTDNTKSKFPPDFINKKDKLMMELMRIDDHSKDGKHNATLEKEAEMINRLSSLTGNVLNKDNVCAIADSGLPTNEDHNYKNYYLSFQRVIRKHASKISLYRKNHPDKKLIFLVFNETSGVYFKVIDGVNGELHMPFCDKKFINEFIDIDLDYLIFFSPYNHFEAIVKPFELPRVVIFDVKRLKISKMLQLRDYDENLMISNEL